jgi:hypothetical protein
VQDFEDLEIELEVVENGTTVVGPGVFKAAGDATPTVIDRCYPIGTSTLEFTITDPCGNSEVYIITVEVVDLDGPIVDCPQTDIVQTPNPGECSSIAQWTPPTAVDCSNIEVPTLVIENSIFGVLNIPVLGPLGNGDMLADFPIGVNTVTYTFTDEFGNPSTCVFTVTVNEPAPIVDLSGNGEFTVPMCEDDVFIVFSGNIIDCAIQSGDNVAGQIAVAGAPLTVTYTNVNDGFAYFEATGTLAPGTYLVFVTYKGVTVDHLVTVNTTPDNVAPVATACADDMTVYNLTNGSCEANVTVTVPTFVDNCDGPLVPVGVRGDGMALTDPYPVGVTTITWTATDAAGNVGICYSNVIVEDQEAPQIQQLPNITVNLSAVNPTGCSANVTWTEPVVADCSNFSVVSTDSSGDLFSQGVSTVTYTATDEYGNSSQMSFTVTVVDNVPPTVSCQAAPFVIPSICDNVPLPDFTPLVTASDNCQGPLTYTQNPPAGTDMVDVFGAGNLFNGATTTVVMTVTDAAGNSASCSVTIVLQDMNMPVPAIATLGDITPFTTPGASCGSLIVEAPVAFNCQGGIIYGTPSFSNGMVAGSNPPAYVFNAGTFSSGLQITWTYTNQNGLSATQAQFIQIINDVVDPMINVAFPGFVSGNINLGTSDDGLGNCDVNPADAGRNWTVTANTNAHVLPLTMPAVAGGTVDNCGVVELWFTVQFPVGPVFTSTSSAVSVNPADVDYPLGVSTVTVYAEDAAGNVGSSSFTVTVADDEAPVITCVTNRVVNTAQGVCTYTHSGTAWNATATDNCSVASIGYVLTGATTGSGTTLDGVAFNLGVTTVTWTATDGSGNTNVCSFTVTVNDNQNPLISCVGSQTVPTNPGVCEYTHVGTAWDATATDNCSVASITYVLTGVTSGSGTSLNGVTFNFGATTVTWTAVDGSGNTATCSFVVTVVDNEPPHVTSTTNAFADIQGYSCGQAIVIPAGVNSCETFRTVAIPQWADNCTAIASTTYSADNGVNLTNFFDSFVGGNFPVGITTITFTATDFNGNTGVCSITIEVEDLQAPTVTGCPTNQTVNTDPGMCTAVVNLTIPSATDNCGVTSIVYSTTGATTLSGNGFPNALTFNQGVTNVTYLISDAAGNTVSCNFTITVNDVEAPVISCSNITQPADAGMCSAVVALGVTVTDNCTASPTLTGVRSDGLAINAPFPVGTTTVTWNATDAAGNVAATCTQTVTITDDQAPAIAGLPANISVNNTPGQCGAVVSWTAPTATDNCPGATIAQTAGPAGGSQFPVGTTTVTYTATDASGNTSTASFTVTVTDNEAPVASCLQAITISLDANGVAQLPVGDVNLASSDNCGIASIVLSQNTFSCADLGLNTVTMTVTDVNGNSSTCTIAVTVVDTIAPVAQCIAGITLSLDANGTATLAPADVDNGSSDNCNVTLSLSQTAFTCADLGTNTVTLTATDSSGNSSTCTVAVTVIDEIAPTVVCNNFTLELGPDGTAILDPAMIGGNSTDNCGITITAVSIDQFDCGDIGAPIMVTYFATDASGNSASCNAFVTVVDNLAPVVVCPEDMLVDTDPGSITYTVPDFFANGMATATDNCTVPVTIFSQTPAPGTLLLDGTYTFTFTATDASGNVGQCSSFELTVQSTLGVSVGPDYSTLTMYPNPASSQVTIGNPNMLMIDTVSIYDINGRLVRAVRANATNDVSVDVSDLSSSVYMVIITGEDGASTVKRLIKK